MSTRCEDSYNSVPAGAWPSMHDRDRCVEPCLEVWEELPVGSFGCRRLDRLISDRIGVAVGDDPVASKQRTASGIAR